MNSVLHPIGNKNMVSVNVLLELVKWYGSWRIETDNWVTVKTDPRGRSTATINTRSSAAGNLCLKHSRTDYGKKKIKTGLKDLENYFHLSLYST